MNLTGWMVDDWKQAKSWASMWWAGSGLAFNIIAACLLKGISISVALLGFVPLAWLPLIAGALSLLTLIARVKKQKPKRKPDPMTFGIK